MTNEIKNVPELRFPEFKEEWVEKKLGEITSKISDGIHSTPTYDSNGDIYFINGNNLVNGRIDFKTAKKISVQEFNKYKNYLEAKNTLLLSINGTIGNIAKYEGENILLGKSAAYINVVSKFISRCYIFYYLQTSKIYESFLRELTGTTIKNLSLKSIKNIIVYISELDEQQKIGNFFSKLDRQIELEEQKLAKLEEQKKGYMQKIFSQELRFKDENGDDYTEWEKKELGDILTILDGDRGGNYPHSTDFSVQGHTLFLSATNVTKKGFSFKQNQYITEKKSNSMGKGKLVENDIILTTRGSLGNIAWYNKEISKLIPFVRINSGMLILRTNDTRKSIFVTQILKSPLGKRQIDLISFGSAQPQLTKKDVKSYKINLPETKEQQKIGDFFSELDKLVEKQSAKLNRLKVRKQGFLQKMFV